MEIERRRIMGELPAAPTILAIVISSVTLLGAVVAIIMLIKFNKEWKAFNKRWRNDGRD